MADRLVCTYEHLRHLLIQGLDFGDSLTSFKLMSSGTVLDCKVLHSAAVNRDLGLETFSASLEVYGQHLPARIDRSNKLVAQFPESTGQFGMEVRFGTIALKEIGRSAMVDDYFQQSLAADFDGHAYLGNVLRNSIRDIDMVLNPDTGAVDGAWLGMGVPGPTTGTVVSAAQLVAFAGSTISLKIQSDAAAHLTPTDLMTHTFTGVDEAALNASLLFTPSAGVGDTDFRVSVTGTFTSAAYMVVVGRTA